MSATTQDEHPSLLRRRYRLTIRARLTLIFAGLVTGSGAVLIAIVWAFMRFVPTYSIQTRSGDEAGGAGGGSGVPEISPSPGTGTDWLPTIGDDIDGIVTVTSPSDFLALLLAISVAVLLILAVISGFVGWIVAGRVLEPLHEINRAARIAATGSLDHRVGLSGPPDEIRSLSDTFDSMLDALSRSIDSYRRFAANASHELLTPLTTTQTMIEVTLADEDADAATLKSLAQRIAAVNHANIQTVESLLDLAEIGRTPLSAAPFDLRQVCAAAVERGAAEAERHDVDLRLAPGDAGGPEPTVHGDEVLVRQAVTNLVQNAIRHNRRGGAATVEVRRTDVGAEVVVTNTGDPVPEHIVDSLLEPFVRAAGRTANGGRGLGLAIAASVARVHGGELELRPNPDGGLTARLQVPRHPPRAAASDA